MNVKEVPDGDLIPIIVYISVYTFTHRRPRSCTLTSQPKKDEVYKYFAVSSCSPSSSCWRARKWCLKSSARSIRRILEYVNRFLLSICEGSIENFDQRNIHVRPHRQHESTVFTRHDCETYRREYLRYKRD